jgi:hypothetical protein
MNFFILLKNAEQTSIYPSPNFEFETEFIPNDNLGEAPRCDACRRFVGALPWQPPFAAELETWGSAFGDIAFGPGDELLVSQQFVKGFDALCLTGLQGFGQVEITATKKHSPFKGDAPTYFQVIVVRSNAAIDDAKSELVREGSAPCTRCRQADGIKRAKRLVIEKGTWANEDIFRARGLPGKIFVSERFAELCKK